MNYTMSNPWCLRLVVGSLDSSSLGLLLGNALAEKSIVFGLLLLLAFQSAALERAKVAATLQTNGSDQSLDFGRLGIGLSILLLLALDLTSDHIFPNIILLAQVEEFPDLRCPLGTEALGKDVVSESWNIVIPLLDNDDR